MSRPAAPPRRTPSSARQSLMLVLALLAVALKVLVPPGFMVAAPAWGPPGIVVCTAQGPLSLGSGHDHAPHGKTHDAPCAFAGHAAVAAPPSALPVAPAEFVAYQAAAVRPVNHLAPGRGLAAPPLPARGPPSLLI